MKFKAGLAAGVAIGAAATTARLLMKKRTPSKTSSVSGAKRPHIVVAGAGFAGIGTLSRLAEELEPAEATVTLIDQNNYHLFTPLLYQVATGAVSARNLAYSLRRFCAMNGFNFICSPIESIDLSEKTIRTESGDVDYDYLVIGLGSRTNYFGMEEVRRQSLSLKSIPAALELRRKILDNMELASQSNDPEVRKRLMTFIVVGAGATGIELTGSMHELIQYNLLKYYPDLRKEDTRLILVEATDKILPGINSRIADIALERFERIGVEVMLNTMVAGINEGAVVTREGNRIPGDVIVWTAGIRPNPITAGLAVEKNRDGRMVVDDYLRLPDYPEVFALGDNAFAHNFSTGEPLPPNAAVAIQEGNAVGKNLVNILNDKPIYPFTYHPMGELLALGRLKAAAEIGPFVFNGVLAWFMWRVVYLTKLMGMKNRVGVVNDWIASSLTQRDIVNIDNAPTR